VRPPSPAFTLRPLCPADGPAVRRLWNARFGGTESPQTAWIEAALDADRSVTGLVATPPSGDVVLGFSLMDVGRRSYTRRYLGLDVLDLAPTLAARTGIFHLSCVRPAWEGRGIGSAFYERRLAVLARRNVPRAAGVAWHRPDHVDSRALFERYDFARLATVDCFYSRTGSRPHCPACEGICTCTASLYVRRLC
jgi:GNAT superfamily N-acetyltransferase